MWPHNNAVLRLAADFCCPKNQEVPLVRFLLLSSASLPLDKVFTGPVIMVMIMAAVLGLLGALLRSPVVKGWLGEWQVNLAARLLLDKNRYHLVKNVTLPAGEGTTQIDHVIVSRYGIFVVETKNMGGWIFGSERDAKWTQTFGKKTFKFQNPLRQNYKHTETLAELLALPREKIKSLIVFVGGAELKKSTPENVTITGGYIRYIRSHKEEILTEQQVEHVLCLIEAQRLTPNLATHRKHVEHVRTIVAAKEQEKASRPKVKS